MEDSKREQYEVAFVHVAEMKNQELQIYWQRAGFGIAMIGVVLALSGAAVGLEVCEGRWVALSALSLVGIAIAFFWWRLQIKGRLWLHWWNAQLAYAEGQAFDRDVRPWRRTFGEWKPDDDHDEPCMVSIDGREKNTIAKPPYGVSRLMTTLAFLLMGFFIVLFVVMIMALLEVDIFGINSC